MCDNYKELVLDVHYDTENNDIASEFYNKVFEVTHEYKRAVAYFDSASLMIILDGIKSLVNNNCKMFFLVSPQISDKDVEAIEKGYKSRSDVADEIFLNDFESVSGNQYNVLAWLIYKKIVEIKIVFRVDNGPGIFHEKLGIIKDNRDNTVCFHGTNNDTYSAHKNNFESFDVFISWDERDHRRINLKEKSFDSFWESNGGNWESFFLSDKVKKRIIEFKEKDDPFECELDSWYDKGKQDYLPSEPSWLVLRDYQSDAVNEWFRAGGKGIFEMATGTGKTITSITAITRLFNHYFDNSIPIVLIVVLPYKVLLEQWEEDLNDFNINVLKCYDSVNKWEDDLIRNISLINASDLDYLTIVTTNVTFKSKRFQKYARSINQDVILCIDEMHNFLSDASLDALDEKIKYRLGLSATLYNKYKSEKLLRLKQFFGKGTIYEYSMEKAIQNHYLTKYNYYPIFVELEDEYKEEYFELTDKIVKKLRFSDFEDESLQALFGQRARLIASSPNKIKKLKEMSNHYVGKKFSLFYCGDKKEDGSRFIEKVSRMLSSEFGMKVHSFTSEESKKERAQILSDFKNAELDGLTAIRCLDEGVDIPKLERAFIMSSGSSPKEFIQRRGRVLRKAKGKKIAEIYDFITVPTLDEGALKVMDPNMLMQEKKILDKEFERFKEFASLAENVHDAYNQLFKVYDMYKL